jgi:hypothetical protein
LNKWRHYLVPKEFVLYSDNQALQFITRQEKLNQRHAKWIEFMKNFTFFIKHISGNANKVVDALSRRSLILQEFQVKTSEFEHLKEMYHSDPDSREAYEACVNTVPVGQISDSGWVVVQRIPVVNTTMFGEGEFVERET